MTHLSVTEAFDAQRAGATYVDVRSTAEFAENHPAGAVNIPLLDHDEDTGQLMPNPDFIRVMKATFASDAALLIGCRTGGRSLRATHMLMAFGFTGVMNVRGGFEGACTPAGAVRDQGWRDANLPTDTGVTAEAAWQTFLKAADESAPD
jgi:rhodanese-related sulfurtransferase